MNEEIDLNGFVKNTLWGRIKCFFENHYWMCETPIDENGRYMINPQHWYCRRCARYKSTDLFYPLAPSAREE